MNLRFLKLLSIFCWMSTTIAAFLTGYMVKMARNFPEVTVFTRNSRLAGALLLLWLAVSVFFTVRWLMGRKDRDK